MKSFHNTINESGQKLDTSEKMCITQEQLVLSFFQKSRTLLSPFQVHAVFPQYPITSIRRAMTNLTKDGKLIKTDKMRQGAYGKANYLWGLPSVSERSSLREVPKSVPRVFLEATLDGEGVTLSPDILQGQTELWK